MATTLEKQPTAMQQRFGTYRVLKDLLTTASLQQMFRVSELTIIKWRRKHDLPYIVVPGDGRDTIRFSKDEVTTWAKQHGKRIYPQRGSKE